MEQSTAQQVEFDKNTFYRDQYRRVLKLVVFFSVLAIILTGVLVTMSLYRKPAKYYATTTSGIVMPMHSLSEPVITTNYLIQWASLATRNALSISFANYQQDLDSARSYFTQSGWSAFLKAMKSSGLLATVQNEKLNMRAVVSGAPVVIFHGMSRGRYTWRVQLPILVDFVSASQQLQNHMMVTMTIQRVSVMHAAKGIQITGFTTATVTAK